MNKKRIFILTGILSCLLLTMILSACRVVDANTLPKAFEVKMGTSSFLVSEVKIKKGETLNLVAVNTEHDITNGFWKGNTPDSTVESGAPSIGLVKVASGGSGIVGPFNSAGDFHIYCTIHPGMNLVVHVS
jgi:plastocyanin